MKAKLAAGCPHWCGGGHHCTARLSGGEHTSTPEVWAGGAGRVVATRHLHTSGGQGHLELRIVVPLPGEEGAAVGRMRWLIAATWYVITRSRRRAT